MKVRLQADADLNQFILLATIRREPRIDFQTATAAGLSGVDDPMVSATVKRAGAAVTPTQVIICSLAPTLQRR